MILGKKQNGVEENTTIKVIFITEGKKSVWYVKRFSGLLKKHKRTAAGFYFVFWKYNEHILGSKRKSIEY